MNCPIMLVMDTIFCRKKIKKVDKKIGYFFLTVLKKFFDMIYMCFLGLGNGKS